MASRAPTEKMLTAAKAAALRHGVQLPAALAEDFDACAKFLDAYLSRPSAKAVAYATQLAQVAGVAIPEDALASGKALSAWIDANR